MMPRSTSVVPPWMVSFGAVLMAKESWCSSVSRLPASSSTKAASSRTRCGSCCSHTVPMSLTIAASTTGSLPACSMPATETDMRRMVWTCATRADAFGRAGIRIVADGADELGQHVIGLEEALGAGSLIGELACRLLPCAVDLAEHMIVGDE